MTLKFVVVAFAKDGRFDYERSKQVVLGAYETLEEALRSAPLASNGYLDRSEEIAVFERLGHVVFSADVFADPVKT